MKSILFLSIIVALVLSCEKSSVEPGEEIFHDSLFIGRWMYENSSKIYINDKYRLSRVYNDFTVKKSELKNHHFYYTLEHRAYISTIDYWKEYEYQYECVLVAQDTMHVTMNGITSDSDGKIDLVDYETYYHKDID